MDALHELWDYRRSHTVRVHERPRVHGLRHDRSQWRRRRTMRRWIVELFHRPEVEQRQKVQRQVPGERELHEGVLPEKHQSLPRSVRHRHGPGRVHCAVHQSPKLLRRGVLQRLHVQCKDFGLVQVWRCWQGRKKVPPKCCRKQGTFCGCGHNDRDCMKDRGVRQFLGRPRSRVYCLQLGCLPQIEALVRRQVQKTRRLVQQYCEMRRTRCRDKPGYSLLLKKVQGQESGLGSGLLLPRRTHLLDGVLQRCRLWVGKIL